MKQVMNLQLQIELSADNTGGIEAAAMEALAYIKCDIAYYSPELGAYGAKLLAKGIDTHDEEKLLHLVLETTGISERDFLEARDWDSAHARYLFGYFAKKYLEWNWATISRTLRISHSTLKKGVGTIIDFLSGRPATSVTKRIKSRDDKILRIKTDVERIQRKWCEVKK